MLVSARVLIPKPAPTFGRRAVSLIFAQVCGDYGEGEAIVLVFQAVAAHEFWYGGAFDGNDIIKICRDAQKEMCRIF